MSILEATRALLVQSGYAEVSMDRVAERAGVGKQTLYRRWPSKAPLVAEAIVDAYGDSGVLVLPDTGHVAADLRTMMQQLAKFVGTQENSALLRALAAAAAEDPKDGVALYGQITGPQHEAVAERLQRGIECGQVRSGVDVRAVADGLIGACLYRILSYSAAADTADHFDGLVDALIAGIATPHAEPDDQRVRSGGRPTRGL